VVVAVAATDESVPPVTTTERPSVSAAPDLPTAVKANEAPGNTRAVWIADASTVVFNCKLVSVTDAVVEVAVIKPT